MARTINARVCIHSMPDEPLKHRYLVARQFITADQGASLWYYGTFEEKKRAERAAVELGNGIVLEVNIEKPVKIRKEENNDAER